MWSLIHVSSAATQIHSSLLSLSVGAVLLPAAYHFTLGNPGDAPFEAQKKDILHMSHGVSNIIYIRPSLEVFLPT